VAIHLSGLPGEPSLSEGGRAAHFPRLALLRVGFTEPAGSPPSLVRSYRTLSPLPVRARRPAIGGFLSVALSCGSPRLAVSQHPALWSPDLPRHDPDVRPVPRPPGRLTVTSSLPFPSPAPAHPSVGWPPTVARQPVCPSMHSCAGRARREVPGRRWSYRPLDRCATSRSLAIPRPGMVVARRLRACQPHGRPRR
jgi:hypothetical protein